MSASRSDFIPRWALRTAAASLIVIFVIGSGGSGALTAPPSILLSQIPLTVAVPPHPQVLFEIGNSQSVDGDLSGAILTGSGTASTLQNSSSPVNYTIPYGFTPPLKNNGDGTAPYTTSDANGNTADNSASRLNEAKAGMTSILNTYLPVADFALMDFSFPNGIGLFGIAPWNTWVYQMSPSTTGFTFTNSPPQPTVQLAVTPSAVASGGSAILSWSTPWATTCAASGGIGDGSDGWSGSQSVNGGGLTVDPGSTTTYTLTCSNASGTTVQNTTLTVSSTALPAISLAATPGTISAGGSTALNWYASGNPTNCTASSTDSSSTFYNGVSVAYSGSLSVSPAATATYTLTCGTGDVQTTTLTVGAGNEEILNPCHGTSPDPNCATINANGPYAGIDITQFQYMVIGASSDDPSINDVLYDPSAPAVFVDFGNPQAICENAGTSQSTPFPPSGCTLADYNALPAYIGNSILVGYNASVPSGGATETGPTNAGYVPYSPQVLYEARGFGYLQYAATNTGALVVPSSSGQIISAGQLPTESTLTAALNAFNLYQASSPPAGTPAYLPAAGTTLAPETSNPGTSEIKAIAVQSPIAGLLAGASLYYSSNPPLSLTGPGCKANRNVVLLTDGLPTEDQEGNAWPPLGSVAAAGYGVYATYNSDGSLKTTPSASNNDQAMLETISAITALSNFADSSGIVQPINTYIIGLGAGVQPQNNPSAAQALNAMAIAGGTGSYFAATSAAALTADLQQILQAIINSTQSISSAAVNSTSLRTGTTVYRAEFSTRDTYLDWTGDVGAYPISTTTGEVSTTPTWSAQAQLDALGANPTRIIATWQPGSSSGIPFEWVSCSPAPCNSTDGITPSSALGTALTSTTILPSASDSNGQDRLNYLRGNSALEQRNGGTFRNRTHLLGDIVYSSPLYVAAPSEPYDFASYLSFQSSNNNRQPVIYVGSNDGMLHAFKADTGSEMFAFIPNGVFNNLPMLTSPFYNAQHHFFVDGSPQVGDALFTDGNWHSVLVGGENAGGSTIYALDVTDPENITSETTLASKVLWEFSDPANLGATFGAPVIAQIASTAANPAFAVFFGNGYDSASGQPVLYALNPQTGAKLAEINLCALVTSVTLSDGTSHTPCNSSQPNGLSSVAVVNSSGALSAPADTVYAGDLQGNLWRINVSSNDPSTWNTAANVSVLFLATDQTTPVPTPPATAQASLAGNPQPITQAPQVSLNPAFPHLPGNIVLLGTGQLIAASDLASTQTQSMYGIYDPGTGKTYTRSSLVQQTLTYQDITSASGTTDNVLVVSGNPVNLNTSNGWYADLNFQSGFRDVTPPVLENGGVLATNVYSPNPDQCVGGGSSLTLMQNFATGGGFNTGQFLLPGDTSVSQTPGDVVGLPLGSVYATSITVVDLTGPPPPGCTTGLLCSGSKRVKIAPESNLVVEEIGEAGPSQSRTAWWELQ